MKPPNTKAHHTYENRNTNSTINEGGEFYLNRTYYGKDWKKIMHTKSSLIDEELVNIYSISMYVYTSRYSLQHTILIVYLSTIFHLVLCLDKTQIDFLFCSFSFNRIESYWSYSTSNVNEQSAWTVYKARNIFKYHCFFREFQSFMKSFRGYR